MTVHAPPAVLRFGRWRPCLCALDDAKLLTLLATMIEIRDITTVVETGIDWGGSTRYFAQLVPYVFGIDNDPKRIAAFQREIAEDSLTGIELIQQNSPEALRDLCSSLDVDHTLFFLDAHWFAYWPLLDEIDAIPRGQGVIVLHDIQVPNCPSLGYDRYDGHDLTYAYVQDALTAWSPTHRVDYNDESAEGSRRGAAIIYPS